MAPGIFSDRSGGQPFGLIGVDLGFPPAHRVVWRRTAEGIDPSRAAGRAGPRRWVWAQAAGVGTHGLVPAR